MARRRDDPPRLAPPAATDAQSTYEVGYGKPPTATRFKPGRSGNPKGRPKGAKNKRYSLHHERLKEIVIAEAYRPIRINEGARQITVSMAQAVIRAVAVNAVKGQHRSQRLFAELLGQTEAANKAIHDQMLQTAIDYKDRWEKAIANAKARGLPEPDPLPHPDHVEINPHTGEVRFNGPLTKEQREAGRKLVKLYIDGEDELALLQDERRKTRSDKSRAFITEEIARETKIHDELWSAIVGNEWVAEEWLRQMKEKRQTKTMSVSKER